MTTTQFVSQKTGRLLFKFTLSPEEMQECEDKGFCVYCGDEAWGVEPDARKYECESCEKRGVFGAEELLVMGYIQIAETETAE
jgi:hypothetical protein